MNIIFECPYCGSENIFNYKDLPDTKPFNKLKESNTKRKVVVCEKCFKTINLEKKLYSENDIKRILTLIEVFGLLNLLEMFASQYRSDNDLCRLLGLPDLAPMRGGFYGGANEE